MLLRKDTLERIAAGEVDVAFRWWTKPTVRAGGTLQTSVGQLAIRSVEPVAVGAVSVVDARRAGFSSRAELLRAFPRKPGSRLHRIEFELAGPDPRIVLRERAELDHADVTEIATRLERYDRNQPWTRATLELIATKPATRAGDLAQELGQERLPFKANVRKLKALGLTESLEVGYRLSPRGEAFLRHPSSDRARPLRDRPLASDTWSRGDHATTSGRSRNSHDQSMDGSGAGRPCAGGARNGAREGRPREGQGSGQAPEG